MPAHPRYEIASADPSPADAVRWLRQEELNAGDDVNKGVGSGSWMIARHWQAKVFRLAADALEPGDDRPPLRSFTTSSANDVEGTMRALDQLGMPYRVTSGIDLSNEFVGDVTGWLVEVLDGAP